MKFCGSAEESELVELVSVYLTPGKSVCKDQNVDMITYLRPYMVNTKGLVNVIHYYCHFKVCSIMTFST